MRYFHVLGHFCAFETHQCRSTEALNFGFNFVAVVTGDHGDVARFLCFKTSGFLIEIDIGPEFGLRSQSVVEIAIRVRRVAHLHDEIGELVHFVFGRLLGTPKQLSEGTTEFFKCRVLKGFTRHLIGAGFVATPVQWPLEVHTAERLSEHWAFQWVVDRQCVHLHKEIHVTARVFRGHAIRVTQFPRQAVHIAEQMAGATRRIATARAEAGVIQERTPLCNVVRFWVVHGHTLGFAAFVQVNDGDRIIKAGQHIHAVTGFVERDARRAATRDFDMIVFGRSKCAVLQLAGIEDTDLGRAVGCDIEGFTSTVDRHLQWHRQRARVFRRRAIRVAVT